MKEIKIKSLKWYEHIRQRPGMYVGNLDNCDILVREVLDNAIDEALAGYCQNIYCDVLDDYITIADDGRGIPIYLTPDPMNEDEKITAMEAAVSRINTGSKYGKDDVAIGIHGVGVKAVNALSEEFIIMSKITKDNWDKTVSYVTKKDVGKYLFVKFSRAIKIDEGVCESKLSDYMTIVQFKPDMTLMKSSKYRVSVEGLGLTKHILKEFYNKEINYHIPGIKVDFDKIYQTTRLVKVPVTNSKFNKELTFWFSFEFQSDKSKKNVFGSVNSLVVPRGIHVDEVDWGIRVAIQKIFKLDDMYIPYLSGGIKLSVIAMINEVGYSSQTKERLSEIDGWDNEVKAKLHNAIYKSIKDDYEKFELHVAQVEQYVQSLISLKDINIIKSKVTIANSSRNLAKLPWKLVDASSKNRDECELFLLEGDSASGSLRKNRDHKYHAYLPMKGKSLNSVNTETSAVVNNDVLADIFNSIGSGVTGYNDISACRYGKVIIVSDSDQDGCISRLCRIPLLDGTEVTIEELQRRCSEDPNYEFWVYSCTPEGHIVPGRGHSARVTKDVDTLYRITLDNDEYIDVTDNHLFMMRDGSYKRADELKEFDSLMPCYRWVDEGSYNTGREYVKHNDTGCEEPTHWMVAGQPEKGRVIHHGDENPRNNDPRNLHDWDAGYHRSYHAKSSNLVTSYNGSQEQKEMLRRKHEEGVYDWKSDAMTNYNKSDKHRQRASEVNKQLWDSTEPYKKVSDLKLEHPEWGLSHLTEEWLTYREYMSVSLSCRQKGKKCPYNQGSPAHMFGKISAVISRLQSKGLEVNEENYNSTKPRNTTRWKDIFNAKYHGIKTYEDLMEAHRTHNHKVNSIEVIKLDVPEVVYDISVDEHHNFLTSAGVFVHNCHIQNLILGAFAVHASYLIEDGRVYICETPLYKQNGKYFYPSDTKMPDFSKPLDRFKGIAALSNEDVRYTIINPDTRRLTRVTPERINEAIQLIGSPELKKKLMIERKVLR